MSEFPVIEIPLLIDGETLTQGERFAVFDPGKLSEQVASVVAADEAAVDQAVNAAQKALVSWRHVPVADRAAQLQAAADVLEKMADALAITLSRELGMLLLDTTRDAANGLKALREAAAIGPDFMAPQHHEDADCLLTIEKLPHGVVAAIVPWNAPMSLTMGKLGPALVTGNTLVIKPSPLAPVAVTQALLAMATLLPAGVLNVLNGQDAGELLVNHRQVNKIAFTGSIPTGRAVMAGASKGIKHLTMELGGNDPAIVLDDADPDAVAPGIFKQAMTRSGQICYAVKRVYVPQRQYQRYCEAFCALADKLIAGYGRDPDATLAPVNNLTQYNVVMALAERAERTGARVQRLGTARDYAHRDHGYYIRPMIVTHIDPRAELVQTEQFGPILPIVPYRDEAEAVRLANATEYGLASSVWSADAERALSVSRQIEAGVTFINSHSRQPLGDRLMPFGGVKQSGLGRTRTAIGMAEYTEYHAISVKK